MDQISSAIERAIREGRLGPGTRLPSWHDLAVQLGVARGTVRMAYENLRDQQLIVTAGAAGTRVAEHARPAATHTGAEGAAPASAPPGRPAIFQVGVPAHDAFPFKTWSRIMGRAARAAAAAPVGYPDPFGERELRTEIAAYLSIARGIECTASQIFITNGFGSALAAALRALGATGESAWVEEPGFTVAREILAMAGITPIPVPVDAEGLNVAAGVAAAPQASFAVVTPGQHAPLGMTLSLRRRHALLDWAATAQAWVIEDDYLGELQLQGRATPGLASLDRNGRVLHIGTFSKTINPSLRVAFLMVPRPLVDKVASVISTSTPAPAPSVQLAVAEFMRGGHYLRHLRRMKRLYAERRRILMQCLRELSLPCVEAGLAALVPLPDGVRDIDVVAKARQLGMMPSALSWWHSQPQAHGNGLLLGVTNLPEERIAEHCKRLAEVLAGMQVQLDN
ncbi:MocR-like pyridoxine biosynthesis transcription factor PdxR [Massilia agilis]|uniref:MocR-like pyridoxine biosynthesis transcription factor PdxR n=1 Tax=Massilia agilis TaxID=1811226 RepID=UPI00351CE336